MAWTRDVPSNDLFFAPVYPVTASEYVVVVVDRAPAQVYDEFPCVVEDKPHLGTVWTGVVASTETWTDSQPSE